MSRRRRPVGPGARQADPATAPEPGPAPVRPGTVIQCGSLTPPRPWASQGLALRVAAVEDQAFLRALYADVRADEVALAGWPVPLAEAFLDSQFDLQSRHYARAFPGAEILLILAAGAPIGRLYLHDSDQGRLIVEFSLLAAWRGRGLGGALIRQVQAQSRRAGLPRCWLHVAHHNPAARRLYDRLGFRVTGQDQTHCRMDWTPQ